MATLVLTQEIESIQGINKEGINKVECVSETNQVEVAVWHYHVPCVGVRYYSYDSAMVSATVNQEEAGTWELDQLVA